MKKSEANFIINSIIAECRSRHFCCHGCPFLDKRYGHCTFNISRPSEWSMRKETHKYKIEHLKEGEAE